MLALDDYVQLTVEAARDQWLSIGQRSWPTGRDQVDYLPVETLVCFGLGLIERPSKFGSVNLRASSPHVQNFARLFKRTEKSLAAKLANLDGRRPNGARHEQELWIRLGSDALLFPALYASIITGARSAGLDAVDVPDFLDSAARPLEVVFDAVKVTDDQLREAAEPTLRALAARGSLANVKRTERAIMTTARIGQQQFARSVLDRADFKCVFCGLGTRGISLPSSRMLIASHIKPWKDSTAIERMDPANGLAACPTHDAAFENHLITVDREGVIHRSEALRRAIQADTAWAHNFGPQGITTRLRGSQLPGRSFVDWHFSQTDVVLQVDYDLSRLHTTHTDG
ncbi:HNH endonuclease [Agromyces bauzanensis]|uniref:Restriction endonuclease n=1 Tax=Agromyces bauzanensis TaxID=1308924 RepID=A0A917PW78_9MICO|nr:HNH endonuclease [Agromyces bauzanensis]GGJ94135.1 restriction endonuclease [Agromyces bauzanensis]